MGGGGSDISLCGLLSLSEGAPRRVQTGSAHLLVWRPGVSPAGRVNPVPRPVLCVGPLCVRQYWTSCVGPLYVRQYWASCVGPLCVRQYWASGHGWGAGCGAVPCRGIEPGWGQGAGWLN